MKMTLLNRLWISLAAAVALGAAVAALSPGAFLTGWLAAGLLSWICLFALLSAWQWADGGRLLFWMTAAAFFLRLGLGIGISLALPEYGFDEPPQNAGYLFYDAYRRDIEAFDITKSGASFQETFTLEFDNDQYGGMLVFTGLIYMYLSPDAHRAFLVILLAAFAAAVGVPFLWRAAAQRWNGRIASLAAWMVALYPDYVLFSSSQMREPFLVGLACIAVWGVVAWRKSWQVSLLTLALSISGMMLVSSRSAVVIAGVLGVWFWLEYLSPRSKTLRLLGYAGIGLAALGMVYLSWEWLRSSAWYDLRLTVLGSGRVQYELETVKEWLKAPFLVGYGLAQPVLPAAIAYPTLPIWKFIAIFRAAGWYALAPLLLYAIFTAWRAQPPADRRALAWMALSVLVWTVVSSARAGGDQWDNPRYRTLLLPVMALLAGWGLDRALQTGDAWLARWLGVEVIFLAFFTSWYFSRYFQWWQRLPFWQMVIWIVVLSALVLASGWLADGWRRWKAGKKPHSH